jgi:uncharacterized protein (TIGR03083 family)
MHPVMPILVADLLPPLHVELMSLLRGLTAEEWEKPTVAVPWTVRDMAAHLLDTDIRRLSYGRDHLVQDSSRPAPDSYEELVTLLNRLNAEWVIAAKRISPPILMAFLDIVAPQTHTFLQSLDPYAVSGVSVAWAGESESQNWFDVAREYTEKWHHQQHIREAVGAPLLTERRWLEPVLDTFLRGLPHTYRDVDVPDGTALVVEISGEAGDSWTLFRQSGKWLLYRGCPDNPTAHIRLDQDRAWRLFTKGATKEEVRPHIEIAGDETLALHLLNLLSIMA